MSMSADVMPANNIIIYFAFCISFTYIGSIVAEIVMKELKCPEIIIYTSKNLLK